MCRERFLGVRIVATGVRPETRDHKEGPLKTTHPPFTARLVLTSTLALLLISGLLISPSAVRAAARGPEAEPAPKTALVQGKLGSRTLRDGAQKTTEYFVEVGKCRYTLVGDAEVVSVLAKHRRKWLSVSGACEASALTEEKGERTLTLTVASASDVQAQKPQTLSGIVRVDGKGTQATCGLESDDGLIHVEASTDRRKLASFLGKNVECTAQLTSDGSTSFASALKDVKRKLLPGERDPKNEREAVAGSWKGTLDVKVLPSQAGSSRKGKYPLEVRVDEKLEKATGKVMGTYAVDSIRVRKFRLRTRAIELDVNYNLPGGGTYTLTCKGSFDESWRKMSGSWTSAYVGSGDFTLDVQ